MVLIASVSAVPLARFVEPEANLVYDKYNIDGSGPRIGQREANMRARAWNVTIIAAFAISLISSTARASQVEVVWLGHSTTRITSVEDKVIVIDPFLTKNPKAPAEYRDLNALGHVDLILVTHGHQDHILDLKELAKLTGARVVAPYGFAANLIALGIIDGDKTIVMNKGGTSTPIGRGIKVHMVHADHSSHVDIGAFGLDTEKFGGLRAIDGGQPVGYVIELENGFTIYHSGDTAVFGDMALVQEFYEPDLGLICIGGNFTMDPERAAYALTKFLKIGQVIPIHFGTFPVLNRTPEELRQALEKLNNTSTRVLDVRPGQAIHFD